MVPLATALFNMSIYIISDLHLSFSTKKSMNIFGPEWENYEKKLKKNWNKLVKRKDTVLVPGDISWAMKKEEAKKDLKFINRKLHGKKILTKGNHDYWWTSTQFLNEQYKNISFLRFEAIKVEDTIVCGTKGVKLPVVDESAPMKLYNREVLRLKLSLESAKELKDETKASRIIVMMHYPPIIKGETKNEFVKLFHEYGIKDVYYGHLHTKYAFNRKFTGVHKGINYHLVSADFLGMTPILVE